jgi:hypothetical protein
MKKSIIATVLLIVILFMGISNNASADPWRGHRHGWCGPRAAVRVYAPVPVFPPVIAGGYWGGYYRPHHYCGPRYYGHGYYGHHRGRY